MEAIKEAASIRPIEVEDLKTEVEYRTRLHEICNKIHAARDLDEILSQLAGEIIGLFTAERLTVYTIDGITNQLVSRFKSGREIKEIRLQVSTTSIAGHAALKNKVINVGNVYDSAELKTIHPELQFDPSWDARTGYKTQQVLAHPISFRKYLLGAFQLINRLDGSRFTAFDEAAASQLGETFGIAFYNQKRMSRSKAHRYQYLTDHGMITVEDLQRAVEAAKRENVSVDTHLMKTLGVDKKEIGRSLSQFYRVPFVEFKPTMEKPRSLMKGLKLTFLRKNYWVPLRTEKGQIIIAMAEPDNLQKVDEIKAVFPGQPLIFYVALAQDIQKMIDLFSNYLREPDPIDEIILQLPAEKAMADVSEATYSEQDSVIVQLVNKIIIDAMDQKASDIHIEPYPGTQDTQIRFRIDGICRSYRKIPAGYKMAVISRIKVMASIDIAEKRRPQDGKIRFDRPGKEPVELRVVTIPTQGKMEDVVIRILRNDSAKLLSEMQFSNKNYEGFVSAITQPYGIVLVCGPTGSGKTTTLHAALNHINDVTKKIWTAEDPVELTQEGLRQVQVHPKINLDFASAMRAFLRADPDVIMVGEMRDRETARMGIEASLTGHLVFSTLHTNNAPESVVRLLDMGMDPFNFSDAILCILAQRLLPRLCDHCKTPYHPSRDEFEGIVREYGPEYYYQNIGVSFSDDLLFYKSSRCEKCRHSGYSGRMALHELLMGTDEIKRLIQKRAPAEKIRSQAIADGMTTLKQDGIQKVFGGLSDIKEVRKVCIK